MLWDVLPNLAPCKKPKIASAFQLFCFFSSDCFCSALKGLYWKFKVHSVWQDRPLSTCFYVWGANGSERAGFCSQALLQTCIHAAKSTGVCSQITENPALRFLDSRFKSWKTAGASLPPSCSVVGCSWEDRMVEGKCWFFAAHAWVMMEMSWAQARLALLMCAALQIGGRIHT